MKTHTRLALIAAPALLMAFSLCLCQKGGKKAATPAGEGGVQAKVPVEGVTPAGGEAKEKEKKIIEPPALYVGAWKAKDKKPDALAQAEKEFDKKNYKTAMQKYEAFVKGAPKSFWAPSARHQVARCHYQLSEFDEALDTLTKLMEEKPGLLWDARTMVVLADLFTALPTVGYERDGRVWYNQEVREGEYRYMGQENRDIAVDYREKARAAYVVLLAAPAADRGAAEGDDLAAEAEVNNFSLVDVFEADWYGQNDRCPPEKPLDPPAAGSPYDQGWTSREKVLFLLNEVPVLNEGRSDTHPAAWAGFKKALFLMRFPKCASKEWMEQREKDRAAWDGKHKGEYDPPEFIPVPYAPPADMDPLAIIKGVLASFPGDKDADLYFGTLGRVLEGLERFVEAKKVYEEFLVKYPKSVWIEDVKSSLHAMQHPVLSAWSDGIGYPKEENELSVSSRNVKEATLDWYEADLAGDWTSGAFLNKPYANFTDLYELYKTIEGAKAKLKKHKKVRTIVYATKDKGDHRPVNGRVKVPELPVGTYLLHVHGANVESVSVWLQTDLIIAGKTTGDTMEYFLAESMSGAPVPGFPLTVKESYGEYTGGYYHEKVKVTKATTGADGRYSYKLTRRNDISSNSTQAVAGEGQRVAVTDSRYGGYYYGSDTDETFKIFTYTDRPVYRPGDTIRFKHIVRSYKNGKNNNRPGVKVKMEVSNPKGEKILETSAQATDFGTAWGEVKLEDGAPLGVYYARAYVDGAEYRSYQSSGSNFRVEEYKKPEFEVAVKPSKALAAPGEKVSALLTATYYWGAPVTQAEVKYHVFRSAYWHSYNPPSKWDWLYGEGFGIIYDRPYAGGDELLDSGEGVTDDLGNFEVTLPAMEQDADYDYEYRVTAEVTDLSRRTINGAGSVKFTRDPFYVYLVTPQGFYTEGDKVEVEVDAMTADDEPVQASGTVTVARITYPPGAEPVEEVVEKGKLDLDAKGRGFYPTKLAKAGQYKVTFAGKKGGAGKEVKGELLLTAAGAKFDKKLFRFANIDIVSQARTYKTGDTIRVLVATPWEDATIWVSHEGGDEIFLEKVERPAGGSVVMSFTADAQHKPNFFVRVVVVRDNRVSTLDREIFVPPEEEILEATVEPSRKEFKPREKGQFVIAVKDSKGKPVKGEFSIAVFDSSVLYIQAETSGDIRPYYYGDRRYIANYMFHSAQIYFSNFTKDFNKWPSFDAHGLPSTSGYFYSAEFQAGQQFTCPSCVFGDFLTRADTGVMGFIGGGGGAKSLGFNGVAQMEKFAEMPAQAPVATASAAPMEAKAEEATAKKGAKLKADKDGAPGDDEAYLKQEGEAAAREFFPDTALWKPDVVTGGDGKATVPVEWPDSLTKWAVRIVGIDGTARVAIAKNDVVTTKKLVARLETPRFMVEGDKVKLAAIVQNQYAEPLEVDLAMKITGEGVEAVGPSKTKLTVPAGKEVRHDFEVVAIHAEKVKITLGAVAAKDSDALVKSFEVMEWGSDKMVTQAGIMRKAGKMELKFDVPKERKTETAELVVVAEPSIGGSLLRALPYLIHYPYGCVEQTMSRFLPAVIVARTLKDAGVSLSSVPELARKASLADPVGMKLADPQLRWYEQPVFDDKELDKVVKLGLNRLYDFQHGDGGWAWWKWGDSDPYMSAYVLVGLVEARAAGYAVNAGVIESGMQYLAGRLAKMNKKPDEARELRAYLAYALSLDKRLAFKDIEEVWSHRESISHYGQALTALAAWNAGEKDKARLVVDNLVDVAWADEQNQTASFKWKEAHWWWWYNDRIETVSWTLRALMTIRPEHKYGDWFAKWILMNRQGNQWYSTKDTAIALYALTLYMAAHKELSPDCKVKILVGGKERRTVAFTKENVLAGGGVVTLRGADVPDGTLPVGVEMSGSCSVYANAFLSYFTKEPKIEGSGNEIFIERSYFRLKETKKKEKSWTGKEITTLDYEKIPLKEGEALASGELVEVKIVVEAKNDYEYLVFEDFKPAGCEPLDLKSGGVFENGTWINRELRDEKVVNFLYDLPQGTQTISYRMRAEIPGSFKVLPHKGYAMYAPRVKAISDSAEIVITE